MTPPESSTSPAPTVIVRPATAADLPRIGRLGALLVEAHYALDAQRFLATRARALMAELPTPLHRSIVQFAYYTGWRRGEILGLTWDQINWESKVLRIEPPTEEKRSKGEDARVIPFAKTPLEGLLKERWQERDGLFVFHRNGERLFSFYKVWRGENSSEHGRA